MCRFTNLYMYWHIFVDILYNAFALLQTHIDICIGSMGLYKREKRQEHLKKKKNNKPVSQVSGEDVPLNKLIDMIYEYTFNSYIRLLRLPTIYH